MSRKAPTAPGQFFEIAAGRGDLFGSIEGDALDEVHGQDAAAGEARVRFGKADARVARKCLTEELEVPELAAKVELAVDDSFELIDEGDGTVDAELGEELFRELRQFVQDCYVVGDLADYVRVLYFHGDLPAIVQRGAMDLADRPRRQRRRRELREQFRQRPAEFAFDGGLRDGERIARHVGLKPRQLAAE